MKYFNQGVMSLCLVAGLLSGGQALAQVTNTTPNGDTGMISTPSLEEDTNLSTPTNGVEQEQAPTETSTKVEVDMPDINLPATTPEREVSRTETTTTERTLIQTDENDAEGSVNTLYLAIIGIVAVFLVAVIGMLASRRETPYQP